MEDYKRIYAKVDLDAIEHNVSLMESLQPHKVPIMAVIKTNGYGHGAIAIAHALERHESICGFAVATAEEAMELRDAGIKKMILILGFVFERDIDRLIDHDIRFCVFRYDLAKKISEIAVSKGKTAYLHIKLDTGMGRIGFLPEETSLDEISQIAKLPGLCLEGVFTHFARADELDKTFANKQYEIFESMILKLEKCGVTFRIHHCANSATILSLPNCTMDMMRAGITLYGLCPSDEVGKDVGLQPALSLYSHIVHMKQVDAGTPISYGGTYVTDRRQMIATVPVGYGDGYPRALSNKGYVLVRGKKAPILGRVCMDQLMIDVTEIPDVAIMDEVVLIGTSDEETITMEQLGELSGRFNYELACDLGNRIPRYYYQNGNVVGQLDFFA